MLTLLPKPTGRDTGWADVDRTGLSHRILEQTAEGCWVVDRDLVTVHVNPALCALLGYRDGELIGTHMLVHVAPESRAVVERQAVMRDLVPHRSYEIALTRADGTVFHALVSDSRLEDEAGQARGSCLFVSDNTHRRDAEMQCRSQREALADTVARMNRFLGQICQDLKDPLSAILGATQMMEEEGGGPGHGGVSGYASLCSDAGHQILRTVENLSLWSRLQLNQVSLDLRVYELGGLLQDILEPLEPRARARGILIVNRISGTRVLGDLTGLMTVLRHLIDNAVRFSPSGSIVMLSAQATDGCVAVRVQDNGLGMPEDVLSGLFRIDHHHAAPGADGEVGSGLGLLIAKAMVERMGGAIRVYSRPGGGTAVTVTLTQGSP